MIHESSRTLRTGSRHLLIVGENEIVSASSRTWDPPWNRYHCDICHFYGDPKLEINWPAPSPIQPLGNGDDPEPPILEGPLSRLVAGQSSYRAGDTVHVDLGVEHAQPEPVDLVVYARLITPDGVAEPLPSAKGTALPSNGRVGARVRPISPGHRGRRIPRMPMCGQLRLAASRTGFPNAAWATVFVPRPPAGTGDRQRQPAAAPRRRSNGWVRLTSGV